MSKKLGGILAAVSTPFTADGAVDEAALRGHVDFLIGNGLHGLVPGGKHRRIRRPDLPRSANSSTRWSLNRPPAGYPSPRRPGPLSTAEAINLSKQAADDGADAVLLVQPFYEAPTRHQVIEYFATVGEAAGVPVIAYNLPGVTGMNWTGRFTASCSSAPMR